MPDNLDVVSQRRLPVTFGTTLYSQELEFVEKVAATFGLSTAAAIRWIINDYRRIKREQEGTE